MHILNSRMEFLYVFFAATISVTDVVAAGITTDFVKRWTHAQLAQITFKSHAFNPHVDFMFVFGLAICVIFDHSQCKHRDSQYVHTNTNYVDSAYPLERR